VFLIDAGIHAREWGAHVVAMYIMKKVVNYEERFANKMTFIIIPCVNPDGYEYSHTTDRFWRKSRSEQNYSKCIGVDLNRNFNTHWRGNINSTNCKKFL
jgi:murein tripeptide amidase MpaA